MLEVCCRCGFVHKDSRIIIGYVDGLPICYRGYKPHYHWTPLDKLSNEVTLHATICVACCDGVGIVDWKEFVEQQKKTPEHYKVPGSLNAPLPDRFLSFASHLYTIQSTNSSTWCTPLPARPRTQQTDAPGGDDAPRPL